MANRLPEFGSEPWREAIERQLIEQSERLRLQEQELLELKEKERSLKKGESRAALQRRLISYVTFFATGLLGVILLAMVNGEIVDGRINYEFRQAETVKVLDIVSKLLVAGSGVSIGAVALGSTEKAKKIAHRIYRNRRA